MQTAEDNNAKDNESSGAAVGRAIAKASSNYSNDSWDLVDAWQAEGFDWAKVKKEDLPKEMQKLDLEGRKKYVAAKLAERKKMQEEINKLQKARNEYVAKKRVELAKEGEEQTLDVAVTNTVRKPSHQKRLSVH